MLFVLAPETKKTSTWSNGRQPNLSTNLEPSRWRPSHVHFLPDPLGTRRTLLGTLGACRSGAQESGGVWAVEVMQGMIMGREEPFKKTEA